MNGDKKPLKDEEQDLNWQREEESDNLQKSERPDKEYMDERNLCVQCQGVKRECDLPGCPQKVK
jgi:hypothetical protein